tara:strand:+ start:7370 stop:7732 length:363 start_codon:yes stop_codon:yes gene_type:complete
MNLRAKDRRGNNLEQAFNGQCFQWILEGQDVIVEFGTGYRDRHDVEVFEGDTVLVHHLDGEGSKVVVKFGEYPSDMQTAFFKCHTGFYLEDSTGGMSYIGLLNENTEIINTPDATEGSVR